MMNVESRRQPSLVHIAVVVLWRNDLSPAALEGLRNECSHPVSILLRSLNEGLHLPGILRSKVSRGAVLVGVLPSVCVWARRLDRNPHSGHSWSILTVVTLGQYSQWSLLVNTHSGHSWSILTVVTLGQYSQWSLLVNTQWSLLINTHSGHSW